MKNKGFTLAEVLGVVVILGLLVIVAFPPLLNQLKKSKNTLSEAELKILGEAAGLYIDDHLSNYPTVEDNVYCISLDTLVKNGYLKSPIIDATTNEEINEVNNEIRVVINGQNDYSYDLRDKTTSDKCVEIRA